MGMGSSTRFAVGIHLLTALAANPGKVLCSEDIADSVNTNPVVVRRLFALLTAAGLARARLGQGGGFKLGWRPASNITLLDIFAALEKTDLFGAPRSPPSASCRVGAHILPVRREATARRSGPADRALSHDGLRYRQRRARAKQRSAEDKDAIFSKAAFDALLRNRDGHQ
jgi:DNA-binding IscR family transcriptional regulator